VLISTEKLHNYTYYFFILIKFGIYLSRNASRLANESREAMFRRAMSLLSARCASVRQDPVDGDRILFSGQPPKYFYVTQDKPVPMEPLKVRTDIYSSGISITWIFR